MTATPPPAPPETPMEMMPVELTIVPQRFSVQAGTADNGDRSVLLAIFQPLNTQVVVLSRDAALALSDQLREAAGGLQVVRT